MDYYHFVRNVLFALPAEPAHQCALWALSRGLVPKSRTTTYDNRLGVVCAGMGFENPIGLAPGFDKNAEAFQVIYDQGFGCVEVGTVTPKPQAGNPKPRMFRLKEDRAVINRLGFNNEGYERIFGRIYAQDSGRTGMLGINIGKNKDSEDALEDYLFLLREAYMLADYITINISSPNTLGLRDLQQEQHFEAFIKAIMQERNLLATFEKVRRPVWVKVAPDMEDDALCRMLDVMMLYQVDAVIISNTTIARPSSLKNIHATQTGGLSGAPLRDVAEQKVRVAFRHMRGAMPIIGVGGIMDGADAVARMRAGATLIQLYSGLVYRGFALVEEIKEALVREVERLGVGSVADLVGLDA
ncbi:MAG: quinone-dependent dihydroorotate dehydrogenase [Alphaproteobacteria bacterium]|nr:MAG: quinone-dependent dihydroorotate dehydrogenase [Alphaproteobacteria bacterium]TAF13840.1 MAG: quinone-dependent dihydroorotate dehydrogenase [Alphaproteobacteria bacterium]TAF76268.1 MAG: quinone-dependent dihydroorotate dehydrogenase [Alphaproteobacteria bacterium]